MSESRTAKSVKNSAVALGMFFIQLLLQFYSRKIFLDYLGTDILGLNTTATNLLQFLNLAELGVGAAIAFTLYKPLFEKDHESINEILTLQGWYYRKVAYFLIGGSCILACFFPLIFHKIHLPLWYAYASFGVLLYSSLLSYFANYRQVLLSADQKDYKIQYSYRLIVLTKIVCQMVAMATLSHPYLWWLILEFAFATIAAVTLDRTLKRTYPFLKKSSLSPKQLRQKYPTIITKVKQLFFHKIGSFALSQTSPLIIYAYTTLSMVALYGNYLVITNGCIALLTAMFNSVGGGIGNLIAQGDKNRMWLVFRELFCLRFIVIVSLCYAVYCATPYFVTYWIGKEYILSRTTLLLMLGTLYIMTTRLTVDGFINGFGLFGDVLSPIIEAGLNIGISIWLGSIYGLNGVIAGVLISLICMMIIWKPYYLFTRKMKGYYKKYIVLYVKNILVAVISIGCLQFILTNISDVEIKNIIESLLYGGVILMICVLIMVIVSFILRTGIELFFKRIAKYANKN